MHEAVARRRSSGGSNNTKTPTNEEKHKVTRIAQEQVATQHTIPQQTGAKNTALKEQESMQVKEPDNSFRYNRKKNNLQHLNANE